MEEDNSKENSVKSFDSPEINEKEKRKEKEILTDIPLSPIRTKFGHKRNRSPLSKYLNVTPSTPQVTQPIKAPDQFQLTYSENQLSTFEKNISLVKSDFLVLEEYEKKFFKDTTLDIMFIMDITGSMGMWLQEAKTNITNIITEITENNPCSKIRIGFVGYRDITDETKPVGQYVSLDFTENVEQVKAFISEISSYGGGDEPEDIAGAFNLVLNMKWESNARYAVLVCDAPCHGNQYHGAIYDKFSEGDPNGLVLEDLIAEFIKKNITLYCVEINDSTKKMFKVIREIYDGKENCEFHVETLGNSTNKFAFFVAFSASVTLGNITYNRVKLEDVVNKFRIETIETIIKKYNKEINTSQSISDLLINEIEGLDLNESEQKMFNFINRMSSLNINRDKASLIDALIDNKKEEEVVTIDINESNVNFNQYYPAICHSIECKNDSHIINNWQSPIVSHNKLETKFNIDNVSSIHYEDISQTYNLVIYDYTLNKKMNCTIEKTIEKNKYNSIDTLIKDYLTNNALCNHIAEYFNLRIIEYFPSLKTYFKFKDIFLYEVQNFPSRYLIGSNDVNEFSPISTNNLTKNAIDAFTHFSYQFTEGNLIITNIEYDSNNNIITNYTLSKLEDNAHGTIMKFFVSHYCNDICKKLKLVHPRKKKIDFTLSNEFYYHHIISGAKLCQLCKIPIYSKDNVCVSCIDKKNKSMKKAICSECHNVFSFSGYYYNVKMMNYPTKCDNCTFRF